MIARLRFWLASLLLLAAVFSIGCGGFINAAYKTKGVLAVSALAAISSWQSIDLERQKSIVEGAKSGDEARAALKAYREGEQAKAVKAIRGARYALAALSDALDAYDSGIAPKGRVAEALVSATAAAADLIAALRSFGVNLAAVDWPRFLGVPLGPVPLTLIHDLIAQRAPLFVTDTVKTVPCLIEIDYADGRQLFCYQPKVNPPAVTLDPGFQFGPSITQNSMPLFGNWAVTQ